MLYCSFRQRKKPKIYTTLFMFYYQRFGPSFPCICCHRLLFNISVVQIDLEKFENDVNGVHENIFEETIHFKTPSYRNKYFISYKCKNGSKILLTNIMRDIMLSTFQPEEDKCLSSAVKIIAGHRSAFVKIIKVDTVPIQKLELHVYILSN